MYCNSGIMIKIMKISCSCFWISKSRNNNYCKLLIILFYLNNNRVNSEVSNSNKSLLIWLWLTCWEEHNRNHVHYLNHLKPCPCVKLFSIIWFISVSSELWALAPLNLDRCWPCKMKILQISKDEDIKKKGESEGRFTYYLN